MSPCFDRRSFANVNLLDKENKVKATFTIVPLGLSVHEWGQADSWLELKILN